MDQRTRWFRRREKERSNETSLEVLRNSFSFKWKVIFNPDKILLKLVNFERNFEDSSQLKTLIRSSRISDSLETQIPLNIARSSYPIYNPWRDFSLPSSSSKSNTKYVLYIRLEYSIILKTPLFGMKMRNKTSRHDLIVYSVPRSTSLERNSRVSCSL